MQVVIFRLLRFGRSNERPYHSDSIGVFGEFGWERLGKENEGCGEASVVLAPLTPMTTTCHGFRAYVSLGSLDRHLCRSSTSNLVVYSHLT